MKADSIPEIIEMINEMKSLLASGIYSKELVEKYNAKIETWEAEIDMVSALY